MCVFHLILTLNDLASLESDRPELNDISEAEVNPVEGKSNSDGIRHGLPFVLSGIVRDNRHSPLTSL